MKIGTITKTLLLMLLTSVALVSCNKDNGPINSEDDIILSVSEMTFGHQAETRSITLKSKGPWHLTDIAGGDGWLTADADAGSGHDDVINITCTENAEAEGRSAYVRFMLDGIYPEYRTLSVSQAGIPSVNMEPFTAVASDEVKMRGTYTYEGENGIFTKCGFIITESGKEDKFYGEMVIVDEKRKNEFTGIYPVSDGKKYTVKAFLEDEFGNTFISENEQPLEIGFSFGILTCNGVLRSHMEIKDVVLKLPYFLGDGKTYHIEVSCDRAGLSVAPAEVTMSPEGGVIELPVTGMTEETGTVTFTMSGLPEFVTTPKSVSVLVLMGGENQILYWETFGEGYSYGSKAAGLTDGVAEGVAISDEFVRFSRKEQPAAVYIKEGSCGIRIEKEADAFANDPEIGFDWASAGPVLNLKKKENGTFYIHHLNFAGASALKLQFAVRNPFTDKDLDLFYSEDEGASWIPVSWEKTGGDEKPFVLVHSTSTLPGAKDMSLKFMLKSSDGAKKQIDDLRMIGSFK